MRRLWIVGMLCFGILGGLEGRGRSKSWVRVFFSPEGGAERAILEAIRSSRKEILVAMYMFTSRPIAHALIQARARGVRVHILLDGRQKNSPRSQARWFEKRGMDIHYVYLKNRRGDERVAKFHHKYMVIDRKLVLTGSFNYTRAADQINHENLVLLYDRRVAHLFVKNFMKLYQRYAGKKLPLRI